MKKKSAETKIEVQGATISIIHHENDDFISLTDIARYKNPDRSDDLVRNWLRNRNTLEFLGIWEQFHHPGFNSVEFDGIKMQSLTACGLKQLEEGPERTRNKLTRTVFPICFIAGREIHPRVKEVEKSSREPLEKIGV